MFVNIRKFKIVILISLLAGLLTACGEIGNPEDAQLQIQSNLNLAEVYRQQGQFRASLIEAQNALQLMPENIDARLFVARVFMELGDYNSALDMLNIAAEMAPENVDISLARAESLLYTRDYNAGLELVSNTSVETPEQEIRRYWLIGNFQASLGSNEEAESTFQSVLSLDSTHIDTLISMAKLSYLSGDVETSQAYTDQAIEAAASTDNVDLWIWRGQLATLMQDYPAAENAYYEALDIMALYDTMTAKRFTTLQSILVPLRVQQKNEEALRFAEIIANSPQGQLMAAYSNALSLFQGGDFQQAESAISSTLELAPDHPGSNILLGLSRYQQGDFQEAERLLSEFVDIDSASSDLVKTLADTYLRLNDLEGALRVLEQAIENEPENASYWAMLGIIRQANGDANGAIASLSQALDIDAESPDLHYTLGTLNAQQGNMDLALQNFNEALRLNPEYTNAKSALLGVHVAQNNLEQARSLLQGWLAQNPDSVYNNMTAGSLAAQAEDFADARSYYGNVLELEPENLTAVLNLARVDLLENDFTAAEDKYNQVLAIQPLNTSAMSGLLALGDLTNSSEESIARLQQIISNNPDEFIPFMVLAQYYRLSGDLVNATIQAESAYALIDNDITRNFLVEVTLQQATQAAEDQNNQAALEFAEKALDIDSESVSALTLAARIEAREGNFNRAGRYLDRLKDIRPDQPDVLELEGDILLGSDNAEGAMNVYLSAWDFQPRTQLGLKIYQVYGLLGNNQQLVNFLEEWTEEQPQVPTPMLLLGIEMQQAGQTDEAVSYYERLYEIQPDNVVVLNNLAWIYQDSDPTRSFELASRAAELYPENSDVLDTYGWILYKQNNIELAIETLEKAAELAPDSAEIRDHLETVRQN